MTCCLAFKTANLTERSDFPFVSFSPVGEGVIELRFVDDSIATKEEVEGTCLLLLEDDDAIADENDGFFRGWLMRRLSFSRLFLFFFPTFDSLLVSFEDEFIGQVGWRMEFNEFDE